MSASSRYCTATFPTSPIKMLAAHLSFWLNVYANDIHVTYKETAMSKHKATTKEKEKGGQLVIRIAKSDRAAFIAECEALDTTAAREIRRFMREFVEANSAQLPADAVSTLAEIAKPAEPVLDEPVAETSAAAEGAPARQPAPEEAGQPVKARRRVKP